MLRIDPLGDFGAKVPKEAGVLELGRLAQIDVVRRLALLEDLLRRCRPARSAVGSPLSLCSFLSKRKGQREQKANDTLCNTTDITTVYG